MRKVFDSSRFQFLGIGNAVSYCRLRIWRNGPENDRRTRVVVIATDPDTDDAGTSITNAVESWGSAARRMLLTLPIENFIFIEHYPHERAPSADETFDVVHFSDSSAGRLNSPAWQRIDRTWVEAVIGEELD